MKIILCKHGITGPEPLKWRLIRYFYVQLKKLQLRKRHHFLLFPFSPGFLGTLAHEPKKLDEDYWLLLCLVYKPDAES